MHDLDWHATNCRFFKGQSAIDRIENNALTFRHKLGVLHELKYLSRK